MRTNVEIDDHLMKAALKATGQKTKRAAIEEALRTVVRLRKQGEAMRRLRGKIQWTGNLDESRLGRNTK
jgi:Arc/MetJ family transcription regulator